MPIVPNVSRKIIVFSVFLMSFLWIVRLECVNLALQLFKTARNAVMSIFVPSVWSIVSSIRKNIVNYVHLSFLTVSTAQILIIALFASQTTSLIPKVSANLVVSSSHTA